MLDFLFIIVFIKFFNLIKNFLKTINNNLKIKKNYISNYNC